MEKKTARDAIYVYISGGRSAAEYPSRWITDRCAWYRSGRQYLTWKWNSWWVYDHPYVLNKCIWLHIWIAAYRICMYKVISFKKKLNSFYKKWQRTIDTFKNLVGYCERNTQKNSFTRLLTCPNFFNQSRVKWNQDKRTRLKDRLGMTTATKAACFRTRRCLSSAKLLNTWHNPKSRVVLVQGVNFDWDF